MPSPRSATFLPLTLAALGCAVLGLTACTSFLVKFIPLPPDKHLKMVPQSGKFESEATLVMIAPQTFLFVQPEDPAKRFSFTTHTEQYDPASGRFRVTKRKIVPEDMFTTGSSVPRFLWTVKGLGPLDFAKSSIIHDWLFEAHHRWQIAAAQKDAIGMEKYKDYAASGVANPATPELTVDDAADIMTEAISLEMSFNDKCVKGLDSVARSQIKSNVGDNWAKGFDELRESFESCRTNSRTLHQYSWAIRSKPAKKMWDPPTKGNIKALPTSAVEVVKKLKANGDLDRAVDQGLVAAETRVRLNRLISEYDTRKAGLSNAILAYKLTAAAARPDQEQPAPLSALLASVKAAPGTAMETTSTTASLDAVSLPGESDLAAAALVKLASAVNGKARSPNASTTVPRLTEVRFYHYPEDKAEAENILSLLKSRGIQGRVSFVIDKTQLGHTFQIAFAPGVLATAKTH